MCNLACVCAGLLSHPLTLHDSPVGGGQRRPAGGFRWVAVQPPPVVRYQPTVEYLRSLIILSAAGEGLAGRLCVLEADCISIQGEFVYRAAQQVDYHAAAVSHCMSWCVRFVCACLCVSV